MRDYQHIKKEIETSKAKPSSLTTSTASIEKKSIGFYSCPCEGSCPRCLPVLAKRNVSNTCDNHEIEADQKAKQLISGQVNDLPFCTDVLKKSTLAAASSGGQALSSSSRQHYESQLGYDLSQVRIHNDATAHQAAETMQARAFTQGSDIVMGKGEFNSDQVRNPVLAHELVHVVQQQGGSASAGIHKIDPINQIHRVGFKDAKKEFEDRMDEPELIKWGQFTFQNEIAEVLWDRCYSLVNEGITDKISEAEVEAILKAFKKLWKMCRYPHNKFPKISIQRSKVWILVNSSNHPKKKELLALLGPEKNRLRSYGKTQVYDQLWKTYDDSHNLPLYQKYARFDILEAIELYETLACKETAIRTAKHFQNEGGFPGGISDSSKKMKRALIASDVKRDKARTADYNYNGDIVKYGGNLADAVQNMKNALDARHLVHARALSGVCSGHGLAWKPKPGPLSDEHSLVIIGYENNKFMFWDPDAKNSNDPERGFGYLYYETSPARLTTARNDADMVVNDYGDHIGSPKRHRYQVLWLGPFKVK